MSNIKQPWILAGYALFAKEGPKGLKIEVIARNVGKSKSSFYHNFADLEVFTELLLQYHLERSIIIAQQEKLCKQVVPDLLNLLVEIKEDLLFNRQLRIHRNIPAFETCFKKSSAYVGEAISTIWAEMLGLPNQASLAQIILNLSIENFYLQITEDNLNYQWLADYMHNLRAMVLAFQTSGEKPPVVYGSV